MAFSTNVAEGCDRVIRLEITHFAKSVSISMREWLVEFLHVEHGHLVI